MGSFDHVCVQRFLIVKTCRDVSATKVSAVAQCSCMIAEQNSRRIFSKGCRWRPIQRRARPQMLCVGGHNLLGGRTKAPTCLAIRPSRKSDPRFVSNGNSL